MARKLYSLVSLNDVGTPYGRNKYAADPSYAADKAKEAANPKKISPDEGKVTGLGYDQNSLTNYYNNLYGTGGTGGYYTLDITNMLKAYNQLADADKAAAKQTYDTTRSDLLTSLKRFQEENALNQENQRKAYLSGQASLESAREQADRQTRISAASRGLGGSGLQQLAQLQNLINQGQDISDLATSNQSAMDKLRTLLTQKEEDTDKALANANTTYENALKQINANLAANIANAEIQRANSYVAPTGGSAAENQAYAGSAITAMQNVEGNFKDAVENIVNGKGSKSDKNKNLSNLYTQYKSAMRDVYSEYSIDANSRVGLGGLSNLYAIYTQNKQK